MPVIRGLRARGRGKLIDRLNIGERENFFYFSSTQDEHYHESAQRLSSDSLPAGCWLLYGFIMFGQELEPSKVCSISGGFDLELSIPNRDVSTYSQWRVEARELGVI